MHMKSERAQSLIELAISLVILLYLLSGAVEFGIIFFQYVQIRDAAQEGALYGSLNPDEKAKIVERVKNASDKPINLATDVTVDIYIDDNPTDTSDGYHYVSDAANYDANSCEGHGIKVKVTYVHHVFMPFMPTLIQRTDIPLSATVTDTILYPPLDLSTTPPSC